MAPTQTILRFPQTRKKSAFVLVQAVSTGRHPLDLRLVGTDSFSVFVTTLRQERVASLKHSCPDEEWEEILVSLFSQQTPEGVQATAKVDEGRDASDPPTHLTIEVRRSIQGITKHLGDITLRCKEEEIDTVDWCSTSVLAYEESRASLARESEKVTKLEKDVEDLQTQLNEFIEAKKADEAGLMEKFRDLLNEKKVKIREQQRLLANAPRARSPPEEREVAPTEGRSPDIKIEHDAKGHKPIPSRRSKRKTVTPKEDSSDEEFERMDVDEQKEAPAQNSEDDRTTEAGSDEGVTASEDDDDDVLPTTRAAASQSTSGEKSEAPPPKRALPFATKKNARAATPPKGAESETDSDDEL